MDPHPAGRGEPSQRITGVPRPGRRPCAGGAGGPARAIRRHCRSRSPADACTPGSPASAASPHPSTTTASSTTSMPSPHCAGSWPERGDAVQVYADPLAGVAVALPRRCHRPGHERHRGPRERLRRGPAPRRPVPVVRRAGRSPRRRHADGGRRACPLRRARRSAAGLRRVDVRLHRRAPTARARPHRRHAAEGGAAARGHVLLVDRGTARHQRVPRRRDRARRRPGA